MPRPLATAALLVAALSVAPACRQIVGIQTRTSVQSHCDSCIQDACAPAVGACETSVSCASRLDCSLGCDPLDPTCDPACEAEAVSDVDAIGAFVSCRATSCGAPCAMACGDLLPLAPPQATAACASCVAANCCAPAAACATSAPCVDGLECARAMSVPDGVIACTDVVYAVGAAAYHAFDDCVAGSCVQECAIGADWACVGHVSVPVPSADSVHFTLNVVEATNQSAPIAGLSVVGCGSTDAACATPASAAVMTDTSGAATLTLPTSDDGSRVGFEGYFQITDPTGVYLPSLGFASVPLTQDGASATIIAATPTLGQTFAKLLDMTYDPTLASVIMTVTDCANVTAADVTFTLEAGTGSQPVYYTAYGIPSVSAKTTDSTGTAIAGNVPPGTATVTATSLALNQVVGHAQIFTRAGAISLVRITPTP